MNKKQTELLDAYKCCRYITLPHQIPTTLKRMFEGGHIGPMIGLYIRYVDPECPGKSSPLIW